MPLLLPPVPSTCMTPALEEDVELDIRSSAFDLFWQQLDEQEAEERFAPEIPELSIRQAAFDLFWQQFDEQEAEERFAPEIPELSMTQMQTQTQSSSSCKAEGIVEKESAFAIEALSKLSLMAGSPSACLRKRAKESTGLALSDGFKAPGKLSRSSSVGALRALKSSKSTSSLKVELTSKAIDFAIDCTLRHGMDLKSSSLLGSHSQRIF